MRDFIVMPVLFLAFVLTTLALPPSGDKLEIGAKAPNTDQEMLDISGEMISLNEARKENGLLVVFSCNTCPYVIAWEDRYDDLAELCMKNKVGFIVVNSNEAKREGDDSIEAMQEHAKEKDYDFLYVVDKNHELADAFGADRTPEVFLFNNEDVLKYTGAIDNNSKDASAVTKSYLMDAVSAMVNGKQIAKPVTKSIGCTIKRIS
jgi:peroxiredoxin